MKANSNITALKEAAEAQFKLNPDGALMLDPQFCLFCVEEHERSLTALRTLYAACDAPVIHHAVLGPQWLAPAMEIARKELGSVSQNQGKS